MRKKLTLLLSLLLVVIVAVNPAAVNAATFSIDFDTTSDVLYLVNTDTDTPVFDKNADKEVEPASVTKIMTYIVAVEHIENLQETMITTAPYTVDELLGTGSSVSGLQRNEVMSAYDLLHCLMVPSGNDAAMTFADYVGGNGKIGDSMNSGNIANFVQMMNDKAAELGCTHTHFANPHGLHDVDHYTTAKDMYKIASYARTLPYFTEITSKLYYVLPKTNKQGERTIYTTNNMLKSSDTEYYYSYAKGIKTGHHDQSGYCLVSTATKGGYTYMCLAFGAPSIDNEGKTIYKNGAMLDSKNLYTWAFDNLEMKSVVDTEKPAGEVKLEYAWQKDTLLLMPEKNFSTILPKDVEASSITLEPDIPKSVEAPVKAGDVIGTATLKYANETLATINLVASESVERSEMLYYLDGAKNVITSKWFIIGVIAFVVLFIIYLILAMIYNKKNKNRRRVKKYRKL